jgi:hypothetical protein
MLTPFANSVAWLRPALAGALVVASGSAWAGEKIRFSEEGEKAARPVLRPKPDFGSTFDLKHSAPGGADAGLPPPLPSNRIRDQKLEEFLDQKKNWIFVTPTDSDAALKEMFNVREYKLDDLGADSKSKSTIDRFFEREAEARSELSSKLNARGKGAEDNDLSKEAAETDTIVGLPLEQGLRSSIAPTPELDPNAWGRGPGLGNPLSVAPGDFSPKNFNAADVLGLPRRILGSGSGQFFDQEKREQRLDEFQKSLGVTPARPADPINLQNDVTRQPLNPIVGIGAPPAGTALDTGLKPPAGGLSGTMFRPPISDLITARPPLGSSLAPTMPAPASPTFFQPRPAILEIPRRKF